MRNTLLSLILLLLGACSLFAPRALASDAQQASCLVPNGTAVVHYDTGIHGIVGRQEIFEGSDTVYKYENGSLQCYCDPRGVGIQTNWVNAKNFSQQQIDTYVNDGYKYVASGAAWGLENAPYVAKNSSYSCRGIGGGGGTGGGSSSNNSGSQSTGGTGGGADLLAATGNWGTIAYLLVTGITFYLAALFVKKATTPRT
jgi:hypothetical protein